MQLFRQQAPWRACCAPPTRPPEPIDGCPQKTSASGSVRFSHTRAVVRVPPGRVPVRVPPPLRPAQSAAVRRRARDAGGTMRSSRHTERWWVVCDAGSWRGSSCTQALVMAADVHVPLCVLACGAACPACVCERSPRLCPAALSPAFVRVHAPCLRPCVLAFLRGHRASVAPISYSAGLGSGAFSPPDVLSVLLHAWHLQRRLWALTLLRRRYEWLPTWRLCCQRRCPPKRRRARACVQA